MALQLGALLQLSRSAVCHGLAHIPRDVHVSTFGATLHLKEQLHSLSAFKGRPLAPEPPRWPRQQRRQQEPGRRYSSCGDAGTGSSSSSSNNAVLSNTTSYLRNLDNGAELFLVGTAHVSKRSAEEVRDMIRLVKPDVVMVELCAQRAARLRQGQPASEMDFFKDMLSLVGGRARGAAAGGGSGGLGEAFFKLSMQGMYRFLKSLGMDPGGEFKVAMEEADRLGARVVYGDRDVQDTLSRLAASLSLPDLLRMLTGGGMQPPSPTLINFFNGSGSSFESQVEAMKTRAMAREMSDYMRQLNPQLAAALIDERDQIMVDNLRRLQGRVVGVVGLAHLDGIERKWMELQHAQGSAVARGY